TAPTIRDAATQLWAGKALSPSNERWLKRAPGAARKRDRSKTGITAQIKVDAQGIVRDYAGHWSAQS
ncbi:MAG: hypothetical protein P8P56_04870, partial [Yoonia sp.]|nr:hypothetical protein [Yoonia sp.]